MTGSSGIFAGTGWLSEKGREEIKRKEKKS